MANNELHTAAYAAALAVFAAGPLDSDGHAGAFEDRQYDAAMAVYCR